MKKYLIFIIAVIFLQLIFFSSNAQRRSVRGIHKEAGIMTGYHINLDDVYSDTKHIVELGYFRNRYFKYIESGSANYFVSNEFVLNSEKMLFVPKIGGYLGLHGISAGLDLAYYTDLCNGTFQIIPNIGFGGKRMKIAISPVLPIYSSDNLGEFYNVKRMSYSVIVNIPISKNFLST